MKINWNYIKGVFLITLIGFLYGFSNHKNNAIKVKEVVVEFERGNNLFMNYEMVNKLLIQNGKTVRNQEKSVIDLHKLESNVLSHPMVENAAIFLTVDGSLKAKVKQRTPIARVVSEDESYYIDRQAKRMPLSVNHSERVLIIFGDVEEEDFEEIHLLATTILNDEFLKKQIIGVELAPDNEYVLETRVGEQKIIVGKIENLNEKFENLKSFYNKTMLDSTINNYSSINLKYRKQVVCTKEVEYGA
ncbi:cell division protein FtsQ [Lutibacter sp.]|uniref:cell division protein FtsQ/DivIB n=1 Tax=Lutibacter sp. TaxID=1925666 RepID=UPI001A34F66C|nr:cell division protein FtsQ [Lutibacter sp.]MBI9041619.1 cell division protein FtsQ [Lutibacter sp.]